MKVRHQRTDVPRRDATLVRVVAVFESLDEGLHPGGPVRLVGFVHRQLPGAGHADVSSRQEVFAGGGVEGETVHAVAVAPNEHGRRAVDDVSGGYLLPAASEEVASKDLVRILSSIDRKDGPDADVGVDVRGAVERVEHHHVVAGFFLSDLDGIVFFFGGHGGHAAAPAQDVHQVVLRKPVELLHGLPLDVGVAGGAPDLDQTGLAHLGRYQLSGHADLGEKRRQLSPGLRVRVLPSEDVLGQRDRGVRARRHPPMGPRCEGHTQASSRGTGS